MLINDQNRLRGEKYIDNPLGLTMSPPPPTLYKVRIIEMKWVSLLKPLGQKFEVDIRV